ncbi:MAG: hypothetical protein ACK5DM_22820, partial [Planctomyces sp.]
MANRTQIVCLHEGKKGRSIDPVFINTLIRALDPPWLRPTKGSNLIRLVDWVLLGFLWEPVEL